ncbi:hypothetical protein R6Q57_018354 [Mikania cordata]
MYEDELCTFFWWKNWRFSCFKDENLDYDGIPETAGDTVEQEPNQLDVKHHWPLKLRKAVDVIFSAEPWTVPWTAKTVIQVPGVGSSPRNNSLSVNQISSSRSQNDNGNLLIFNYVEVLYVVLISFLDLKLISQNSPFCRAGKTFG